jgi:hypothetical protein
MVTVTGIALSPQPINNPDWPLSSSAIRNIFMFCSVGLVGTGVGDGWGSDVRVGRTSVGDGNSITAVGLFCTVGDITRVGVPVGIPVVEVGTKGDGVPILTSKLQAVSENIRRNVTNLFIFI